MCMKSDSTETDIVRELEGEYPWQRMKDEPWLWFQRFTEYFLPLGPGRSLYKAYSLQLEKEDPAAFKAKQAQSGGKLKPSGINAWGKRAKEWRWRERSHAYDSVQYKDAQAEVELARLTILSSANNAAQALVDALTNERLKVAAAKEILDRAGLPGTTNIGIGPADKFTADELNQAEVEISQWESQQVKPRLESNG